MPAGRPEDARIEFTLPRKQMESLAGPMTDAQARSLTQFARLLMKQARNMSLVSKHELGHLDVLMVDSAALLSHRELPEGRGSWTADLGTGAGLPGIVLAILRPKARIALVDSRRSRVVFLKAAERELELSNIEIVHERIEALGGHRAFELCVAKALGKIDHVLLPSLAVVAPGGSLVLFKGPKWQEERDMASGMAEGVGARLAAENKIELPGMGRATTFVEFVVPAKK